MAILEQSTSTLLAICALLSFALYRLNRCLFSRPLNFPPGPPSLPFFGAYPLLLLLSYRHLHVATTALARWYRTDVLGFYYRSVPVVTVHSLRHTREVLLNPDLDGRPVFELIRIRDPQLGVWGVFFRDGAFWREQRRFTLRNLRDFGFGRRFAELESHANEELLDWIDMVRSGGRFEHEKLVVQPGGVVELPWALTAVAGNLFLKCALNERMDRKDLGALYEWSRQGMIFQRNACVFGRFFSLVPSWRYFFPNGCGYVACRQSSLRMHEFAHAIVEREYGTFDGEHERHFLDLYFKEMREAVEQQASESAVSFQLHQLTHVLADFMLPSLIGISTSAALVLKRFILHPAVLKRARNELETIVGAGRLPSLDDRQRTPYFEACIRESLRLDTLVPSNLAHRALCDTKIGDYTVPKDGIVITIFHSAHRDADEFADALAFRPERYLDAHSGRLDVGLDKSLPFGLGKRLCAGETFARNMLYLFLAAIVQNFEFSTVPGERMAHPERDRVATGFTKTVPDFRLKFTSR